MRKFLLAGAAAVGLTMGVTTAGAAPYVGVTPSPGVPNEVMGGIPVIEGWYNANLFLFGGPADIKATLIGYEAGFTNRFTWTSTGQFLTGGGGTAGTLQAPLGTNFTVANVLSGLLPFAFTSLSGGVPTGGVANGANVAQGVGPNFFVTLGACPAVACIDQVAGNGTPGSGKVAWLWLDDQPASADDNHDDLVIRLEIVSGGSFSVPEPASMAILGAGLLGLGFAARRRRAMKV